MKKIVDAFLFNNEIDLLKSRLEYLYDYVDKFLIVESDHTHSGKQKPLYLKDNLSQFDQFKDKIDLRTYCVDDSDVLSSNSWLIENKHRDFIANCLDDLNEEDVIIVSDCDEIFNVGIVDQLKEMLNKFDVVKINGPMFYYNLKLRLTSFPTWGPSYATSKSYLKNNSATHIRLNGAENSSSITGGWHLTYFMSPEMISKKLESFAHTEYNTEHFKNIDRIKQCMINNTDPFNREDHEFEMVDPEKYFPKEFLKTFYRWL